MAESQTCQNAPVEIQKETDSEETKKPATCTDETNNASASNNQQTSEGSESLEDLLRTLHKQINTSDWLEKNTAEKWVKENPDIAQPFLDASEKAKKS